VEYRRDQQVGGVGAGDGMVGRMDGQKRERDCAQTQQAADSQPRALVEGGAGLRNRSGVQHICD
jgi:hypothetical protein